MSERELSEQIAKRLAKREWKEDSEEIQEYESQILGRICVNGVCD